MATHVPELLNQDQAAVAAAKRRLRYEELRKKLGRSKLQVEGKPELHYFWADNVRDQGEVIRLTSIGYFIVREPKVVEVMAGKAKAEIVANGLKEDGTYVIGDVILMACPLEVYEFLELDVVQRHEDLARSAVETFEQEAQQQGTPTFRVAEPRKRN
jgi:hypothetical protein